MRIGLQIFLGLFSLIPIYFGVTGILHGIAPMLADGAVTSPAVDNQFRYLSAFYLSFAFLSWYVIGDVAGRGMVLRILALVIFIGGLARMYSVSQYGPGLDTQTTGMWIELIVPPILVVWQALVARHHG